MAQTEAVADAKTGAISVADRTKLDYEAVRRFTLTVRAHDLGPGRARTSRSRSA